LKLTSNNSWVAHEPVVRSRGAFLTASLALDLSRAESALEVTNKNNPHVLLPPSNYCRSTLDEQNGIAFTCYDQAQAVYQSRIETDKVNFCHRPKTIACARMKNKKIIAPSSPATFVN
jgi:hypothetical protein